MKNFGLGGLLLVGMICSATTGQERDVDDSVSALKTIKNKQATDRELLLAVEKLKGAKENLAYWTSIANDPDYRKSHRKVAVYQLFKRHVPLGTKLADLGSYLDRATWLEVQNIEMVTADFGRVPVKWAPNLSVGVIRIFPELGDRMGAVYMRFSGEIDSATLRRSLRKKTAAADNTIVEIGYQ